MSRHRIEAAGELWWVGYDTASVSYFADRDEDLDRDDYDAPHLPTFADLEGAVAGQLTLPRELRDELAAEEPARIDTVEARAVARTDQLEAAVRDTLAEPLDPALQRIVDLNKRNFPTSATEIRPPTAGTTDKGRGYRPLSADERGTDHGYDR
jgi:hypothetical protein